MINRDTVKLLALKPVTKRECHDFYVKINTEFKEQDAIKEAVTWWQEDPLKLNSLWWVLNYYSESFDPDRQLRAVIERYLDDMAEKRSQRLED